MATSVVNPRAQFFANNGRPLIGGRIHTYVAGSSTRATTYKDAAKAQPNTNPIVLDGRGEAQIYLAEGVEYKFVVEDSKGALIYTQEPVYGAIWPNAESWPSDATLSYQYMTEAKAAAGAIGPINFYDTYAQAMGDIGALASGDLIEVSQDETRSGARTRYKMQDGALVFVVNLDQVRLDLANTTDIEKGAALVGYMPSGAGAVATDVQSKLLESVSVKDFGAVGDGVTDDTAALNAALLSPVEFTPGVYSADPLPVGSVNIKGHAAEIAKMSQEGSLLSIYDAGGGLISDINLRLKKDGSTTIHSHHIAMKDGHSLTLKDINILGAEGSGFGILAYPDSIPFQEKLIIQNIRGTYNQLSPNNTSGLIMLAQVKNSIVSNIVAKGFKQFGAVELKDSASHNVISGVIADECMNGVYLGSETPVYPSLNVFSGVSMKKVGASGIVANLGSKNLFSNFVIDFSESEAVQPHAVSVYGEGNAFCHLMIAGIGDKTPSGSNVIPYPVRFRDNAKNNFASTFAQYDSPRVAVFDAGAKRNFLQMLHPGDKTYIFNAAAIAGSGGLASIDGTSDSNVVHAPALGQFFGSMTGGFQWWTKNVALPGSTLFSGDKFRYIADGDVGYAIGGGVSASLKLFKSDGTHRSLYLDSSNRLRLTTSGTSWIEFGQSSIYTNADNTTSLGGASNRLAVVYAATGAINTSDEREKTNWRDQSGAEKAAAQEIKSVIKAFKFSDAVSEKCESARWHFGVGAQTVGEILRRHGLNPEMYAFWCYDEWEDQPEIKDEAGNITQEYRTAGNRYGIRYDELCMFIMSAI